MQRYFMSISLVVVSVLGASIACGQAYPSRPIRVVTGESGGNGDFQARLIAPGLASALGQSVIVENRSGPTIGGQTVANATPDGYSLLVQGSPFWIGPLLEKTPYDPVRDFSPIILMTYSPNVLVVPPSLPVKSVKELIALAKAKPGELNYASAETGGSSHIAAELFKSMTGVNWVHIPYTGSARAQSELMGGQVQVMFASAASVSPLLKSGRLRPLAITSAQPSALFPNLPTVAASGVPGYEAGNASAMFAPMNTPEVIIKRLNQEVVRVLDMVDVKEKLFNTSVEVVGSTPEKLRATIRSDIAKWGKVIKDAGIRAD